MIKVTDPQWDKIKYYIGAVLSKDQCSTIFEIMDNVEKENAVSALTKGRPITVTLDLQNDTIDVPGEQLSEHYALTPTVGYNHRRKEGYSVSYTAKSRSLTHIPTGKCVTPCSTRNEALKLWEMIKKLNIHHDDITELSKCKELVRICRHGISNQAYYAYWNYATYLRQTPA